MSDAGPTTAGVLLAAGRGRRMGTLKQVMAWGDSTVVAAAYDALAPHCDAGMVVVLGDGAAEIVEALGNRPFQRVEGDSGAEQAHSARLGLRRALEIPGVRRLLLHPADHPVIPTGVVEALLARASRSERVVIPTCGGRGGHPVLIPRGIAATIAAAPPGGLTGGLRAYWEKHPDLVRRVEFPGAAGLVMDLDTRGEYDAARDPANRGR